MAHWLLNYISKTINIITKYFNDNIFYTIIIILTDNVNEKKVKQFFLDALKQFLYLPVYAQTTI